MKHTCNSISAQIAASPLAPNLFVIGASKAGSSALHRYLRFHPQTRMSEEKEPSFFVDQDELMKSWPSRAREPYSYDPGAYLELYSGGENALIRGEASVYYAQAPHHSGVPQRIHAAAPNARIIYLIREPVTRTIGHFWQRSKEFQEPLPLDQAVRENPLYRDTSDYAMQITPYIKLFGRERVLVVVAEELRRDRLVTLANVLDWLGLDPHEYEADEIRDTHVSPKTSREVRLPMIKWVRDSAIWQRVRRLLPQFAIQALRRVSVRDVEKQQDAETVEWLRTYFAPRIKQIEDILDRSIDVWRCDESDIT